MAKFQFSMRWLLVLVTVACVALFLIFSVSGFVELAMAWFWLCILPTPLLIIAIYGRGDLQAAAIGSLMPWLFMAVFREPGSFGFFTPIVWLLPMSLVCGIIAGVTHRWLGSSARF